MLSRIPAPNQSWRDLYRAALFEPDSIEIPKRIAEAEHALVMRARELFASKDDNIEEEQALDDAMYALNALRNAWTHRRASATSNFQAQSAAA